jgi:tetratricopeptide (TPR) repeat protein
MNTIPERFALAIQHHQAGRVAEAESIYRGIIQDAPRNAHALHLLGVISHHAGRHQEAINLIGRALEIHGPNAVFHSNLSAAYLAINRWIEAAAHCQAALRLTPDFAEAHHNLGIALRAQGQVAEAETAFRNAIRLTPEYVDAHYNLGAVLQQLGQLQEALAELKEAIRLAPTNAHAQNTLGAVLLALHEPDVAIEHLREAIRLQPDFAPFHNNLGVACEHLSRPEEALQCFRDAVRLDPDYASAHINLGSAFQSQGKMAEAIAEFQETLRLEPNQVTALFNLSKFAAVGAYTFSAEEISKIQTLLSRPNLAPESRCQLHFALAKVYERSDAHDDAFEHCRRANDVRRELSTHHGAAFDYAALCRQVDDLIATFSADHFERVRSFGSDSELPVFILGMPRSGTSLAEQILACHPRIHGAGELPDIDKLVQKLPHRLGKEPYPACMARLDAPTARTLAQDHVNRLRQLGGAAVRVVDKAPFNFLHLGVIATLLPHARVIHCTRDPVDTCVSCYFQNFAEPYPFTLDLKHLGQYYREYQRLMANWLNVLPIRIFELSYEEMTNDQENVSRRLVSFCGVEWDDRCLRFYENPRVVRTFSNLQVRLPMYRTSVGRWRRYEEHLQPLLDALRPD